MTDEEPDIARIAALLGEPARSAICLALCGGRPAAAGELAQRAGVSAQTASNHLAKLVGGRLVTVEAVGRNRFYRLANTDVARVLEALLVVAPAPRPTHQAAKGEAFRFARTCYDHLAGRVAVELVDALRRRGWLRRLKEHFLLTKAGRRGLTEFGIHLAQVGRARRAFARPCPDWSERRPHLAGALGAALLDRLLTLGWLERLPRRRTVRLTAAGRDGLLRHFGLTGAGWPSG